MAFEALFSSRVTPQMAIKLAVDTLYPTPKTHAQAQAYITKHPRL